MNIKSYKRFVESLSGPGNLPMFTYTGVNYGNPNKGVSGHFGDKPNIGPKTQSSNLDGILIGTDDDIYTQDDVKDLLLKYDIWCKQNNESPIPIDKMDSKTVSYISNLIGYR